MCRKINLTQGQFTIVSECNYIRLAKYNWYAWWSSITRSYYAMRNKNYGVKGKRRQARISLAREVLGLRKYNKQEPDHINHNTLDNQQSNLRAVTKGQNQWNRRNVKGYHWYPNYNKWCSKIRANGKSIHLGYFSTKQAARGAYLKAKKVYHCFNKENE